MTEAISEKTFVCSQTRLFWLWSVDKSFFEIAFVSLSVELAVVQWGVAAQPAGIDSTPV